MFYQPSNFIGFQHVQSLRPKFVSFNKNIAFYIITNCRFVTQNLYNYGIKFNRDRMQNTKIYLPKTPSSAPDFKFMNTFISEVERERICLLDKYLDENGLKDVELTNEERKAIDGLETVEWITQTLGTTFNNIKQGKRLKKEDQQDGDIPFVMSGETNTGIIGYISNPVSTFPPNSITVDIFGNTFYRSYFYGAGDDTGVYWDSLGKYNKLQMLFITAAIRKAMYGKFDFGNKLRSSKSFDISISLPLINGTLDYEYMETLISGIQKIVISDVVKYVEKMQN